MAKSLRSTLLASVAAGSLALGGLAVVPAAVGAEQTGAEAPVPRLEALDRGLVAVSTDAGVFLSWRLLGGEASGADETGLTGTDFVVYRDGERIATVTDSTNFRDEGGSTASVYRVAAVTAGVEAAPSDETAPLAQNHLDIPLQKPADGVTPVGEAFTYSAGDVSVGDVDGDGQYEFIVKWDPSNAKDVSQVGYTGSVYIDTYDLDGTLLNRLDLGPNIRAGAHYTQFLTYDFDGDGRAETILKTAPGTKSITYAADGSVESEQYISMPDEDLAAGYSHDDDYRLSADDYYEHLVEMFRGWATREEVVSGQWPATLEQAFGIEARYDYPLSDADARALVDHFVDVYAPARSSRNLLRNFEGFILDGPEYLTVFDGRSGAELQTVRYEPGRGDDGLLWGDYAMSRIEPGNRVDRFLSGVAYLDGEEPSAVFARGYYTRSTIATYDWDGENLSQRWFVDSGHAPMSNPFNDGPHGVDGTDPVYGTITTQGFHSLSAADVDGDGKHEIVYGSATIDDDGSLLYSSFAEMPEGSAQPGENVRLGHGDAMHVADIDPTRPGLEIFTVHEGGAYAPYGTALRDAATGEVLFGAYSGRDTGRGMIGDVRSDVPGMEVWSSMPGGTDASGLLSATGEVLSSATPGTNQSIRWAGDLTTQLVNGSGATTPTIDDWTRGTVLTASGTLTNNGTKGNPGLVADVFGDWREELVVRTADSSALRIYISTELTEHKLYTLMHDPQYRAEVARQQTTYNQPSYTSFYLASDMDFGGVPLRPAAAPVAAPGIGVDSGGVNVTWKAAEQDAGGPVTGYVVTLTGADGAVVAEQTVGAEARRASFAGLAAGRYRASVVAENRYGASAASPASAAATVAAGQPLRLAVNAKAQCVNGEAHVAVYAYNDAGRAVDVRLSALGQSSASKGVAAGKAAYALLDSGSASVPAGSATITAYAWVDGVGYHATYPAAYAAVHCR
ncbi:rhamnogalacturonan lyase family protein [Microbacterium radiodurans]|uniref:Rhamnogalacturonan lyase n=1 Tax=Microbacterium radiodurans TaxID=661398 RepID=A0A5J5ITX9_9MICO|nr:fibronectin type III domain-containing protein [Microbacterium radiodurans]KAA9089604.1 rhamnogalacturonan lyase [Microbacterium radiodurans]